MEIRGNIVDVEQKRIFPGRVEIENGVITKREELAEEFDSYIIPGFIDAHIHIESSMIVPSEFARIATRFGTVATVSDPHEIANVLGVPGVEFMIENAKHVPLKFYFGAPSCVPATSFESAGAVISSKEIRELLEKPEIHYLSEMMNYPGVTHGDEEVLAKIAIAKELGKPIDGHAPGLRGDDVQRYIEAGISTDHECFTLEEAEEKLGHGMKVIIREGSAAKNFEALFPIINKYPDEVMLCSDDKHPDDLVCGHINQLVARAIASGGELFHVLRAASRTPVQHYNLNVGLLQEGDPADCVVVDNLESFNVSRTVIDGRDVFHNGVVEIERIEVSTLNNFSCSKVTTDELKVAHPASTIRVITVADGQLITGEEHIEVNATEGKLESDVDQDVLKLVVKNRYQDAPVAVAFVKNFRLQRGALASTVAHDSHNIIAVGVGDEDIAQAINYLIDYQGGVVAVADGETHGLPLPIAGLMSPLPGDEVARQYETIDALAKELGCKLKAPYMTLSFLALLVIPQLKLSDKGLFDGGSFAFVPLQV